MEQIQTYHSRSCETKSRSTAIAKGALFVIVGTAILLRQIPETRHLMPDALFGVHTLLILLGIYNGIKNSFRNIAWLVLIIIGALMGLKAFSTFDTTTVIFYGVPLGIIALGIFIIFNKR